MVHNIIVRKTVLKENESMTDKQVKFYHATEAAADPKTTVTNVKAVQWIDEPELYLFPTGAQNFTVHAKLAELTSVKKIKSAMTKRQQQRTIRVILDEDLLKLYTDKDGNFMFKDEYLETGEIKYVREDNDQSTEEEGVVEVKKRSLHQIQKEMVIERFNGQNYNAATWLRLFEDECRRTEAEIDQYADVLRLFLEDYPTEWFRAMKKTIQNGPWTTWRKEFRLAFCTKGWKEISDAISFSYIGGSLIEYAFKKHNLLLDSDPDLPERSRIGLIVMGLPNYAQAKISRTEVKTIGELTSSLNQLESSRRESKKDWERKKSFGGDANRKNNFST